MNEGEGNNTSTKKGDIVNCKNYKGISILNVI